MNPTTHPQQSEVKDERTTMITTAEKQEMGGVVEQTQTADFKLFSSVERQVKMPAFCKTINSHFKLCSDGKYLAVYSREGKECIDTETKDFIIEYATDTCTEEEFTEKYRQVNLILMSRAI